MEIMIITSNPFFPSIFLYDKQEQEKCKLGKKTIYKIYKHLWNVSLVSNCPHVVEFETHPTKAYLKKLNILLYYAIIDAWQ